MEKRCGAEMRLRCLFVLEMVRSNSQNEEQGLLSQVEEGMPVMVHRYAQVGIFVQFRKSFNDVQLDLQRKVEKAERIYRVLVVPFGSYVVRW